MRPIVANFQFAKSSRLPGISRDFPRPDVSAALPGRGRSRKHGGVPRSPYRVAQAPWMQSVSQYATAQPVGAIRCRRPPRALLAPSPHPTIGAAKYRNFPSGRAYSSLGRANFVNTQQFRGMPSRTGRRQSLRTFPFGDTAFLLDPPPLIRLGPSGTPTAAATGRRNPDDGPALAPARRTLYYARAASKCFLRPSVRATHPPAPMCTSGRLNPRRHVASAILPHLM